MQAGEIGGAIGHLQFDWLERQLAVCDGQPVAWLASPTMSLDTPVLLGATAQNLFAAAVVC